MTPFQKLFEQGQAYRSLIREHIATLYQFRDPESCTGLERAAAEAVWAALDDALSELLHQARTSAVHAESIHLALREPLHSLTIRPPGTWEHDLINTSKDHAIVFTEAPGPYIRKRPIVIGLSDKALEMLANVIAMRRACRKGGDSCQ